MLCLPKVFCPLPLIKASTSTQSIHDGVSDFATEVSMSSEEVEEQFVDTQ